MEGGYHVLYFVPSRAVPWLLVWTSKTFWPPQESESASSWFERTPQSVLPVMGSFGILRRKRTFLPPGGFDAIDQGLEVGGVVHAVGLGLEGSA